MRLRREKAVAEGNYPGDEEDEEAQVQRAMDLSRAEAEFRREVEQRGGSYERGGGSGSTMGNMFSYVTKQYVFVCRRFERWWKRLDRRMSCT